MEAIPRGEERTWNKDEIRFTIAIVFGGVSFVAGSITAYALYAESKYNGALAVCVVTSVVVTISLFFALYFRQRMHTTRARRPAYPNLEVQEHELQVMEVAANHANIERLNVDAENASLSSEEDVAVPDPPCLPPPVQLPSSGPSSSSLESGGNASGRQSLHSDERSNVLAAVPGKLSPTLPDVAAAVCSVASKCATGNVVVETPQVSAEDKQSSEDSTENEAEQSDSEIRCRKRSPVPPED